MVEETKLNEVQFHFENVKKFLLKSLESETWDMQEVLDTLNNNNELVRTAIEHTFRFYLLMNLKKLSFEQMKNVLDISVDSVHKKLCSPTTPIFLINDILSNLTIDECANIFAYLEDNSDTWKSEVFYSSVRNYLLRMCNDLLKRLSKSQNTVFSGRIHLFLAKLFPLNEKSGLNLMSHFSENATRYMNTADVFEQALNKSRSESMELDDGELDDLNDTKNPNFVIDYNLYKKFWSLQDFFGKPNNVYEKALWKQFTTNANDVFDALKSYKLDDIKVSKKFGSLRIDDMQVYFAKYLTSPKLLDLQLNDCNFRRQVLIQFLILFQYANSEVKFKVSTQVLNEEQNSWIKSAVAKVYQLLKETPPDGDVFASNVKHILEREEIWNKWKNEGCPNFVKEKKQPAEPTKPIRKRPKQATSDFLNGSKAKIFIQDNPEMAKLCNVNHDNLNACKDPNREYLPTLRDFFEEAIEQLDPVNQIEKQYQFVNKTDWSWKALRLLAKRSAFYFMQNQNVKTISEYLEAICNKLGKELQITSDSLQNANANAVNSVSNPINGNHIANNGSNNNNDVENMENVENVPINDDEGDGEIDDSAQMQTATTDLQSNDQLNENNQDLQTDHQNEETKRKQANEERLLKLKQEFQIDEYQDDSQSSTGSAMASTSTPPKSNTITLSLDTKVTSELVIINEETMDMISERFQTVDEWKKFAVKLSMDEDTIAFIESDLSNVKEQCKKILLLWKEREEKKATVRVIVGALIDIGHNVIANELEAKYQY